MKPDQHVCACVCVYHWCSLFRSIQLTASEKETFFCNLDSRRPEFEPDLTFAKALLDFSMQRLAGGSSSIAHQSVE